MLAHVLSQMKANAFTYDTNNSDTAQFNSDADTLSWELDWAKGWKHVHTYKCLMSIEDEWP